MTFRLALSYSFGAAVALLFGLGGVSAQTVDQAYGMLVRAQILEQPYPVSDSFETGKVKVGFEVGRDGRLKSLRLVSSSGSAKVDDAALSMVRAAAPFAAPPQNAPRVFTIGIDARKASEATRPSANKDAAR